MKNELKNHWLLVVGICALFLLTSVASGNVPKTTTVSTPAPATTNYIGKLPPKQTTTFTHTVFAEDGTRMQCPYCPYASQALKNIYASHNYPFYYVSLVAWYAPANNGNDHSYQRCLDYNFYGYPTVWFDGGYNVQLGGYSGNENDYRNAIQQCGNRAVSNIDVTLNVTWLGNAAMTITPSVKNNEATQYNGHIRVYVTVVDASMFGWIDTWGNPYRMAFLDYAQNTDITVNAGGTWTNTMTWDGHNYNNGHGTTFGSIQYGNIEVIAVVFNSAPHQGYSYPPSSYPFTAYWVDNCTGVWVGTNQPPTVPSSPNPSNGSINVDITKKLSWTCTDPEGDPLTYDVYFGTSNPPPLKASGVTTNTYNQGTMAYSTTYYWKIVAYDNAGHTTEGPVWVFTTANEPDTTPPTVFLAKPKNAYLYLFDNNGTSRPIIQKTLIIGKITVIAEATDAGSGVKNVAVFIDGNFKVNVTTPPYTFLWNTFSFGQHTVNVIAYDNSGNTAAASVQALKIG